MPMRSPMRCSASNRVCSEPHSGRASFDRRDQASLSALANPKTEAARAVSSASGWRLSDVCEQDQHELADVVCFGDHVGHREVGAEPVTDAALDLGERSARSGLRRADHTRSAREDSTQIGMTGFTGLSVPRSNEFRVVEVLIVILEGFLSDGVRTEPA
jgi:hypothetical protein